MLSFIYFSNHFPEAACHQISAKLAWSCLSWGDGVGGLCTGCVVDAKPDYQPSALPSSQQIHKEWRLLSPGERISLSSKETLHQVL